MTMLEASLRRFLEHPKRRFLVIILTCFVGLVTVWPGVDKYGGLKKEEAETREALAAAQETVAQAQERQALASERAGLLKDLEQQGVTDEDSYKLEAHVKEMVRSAGCTLNRIDLVQPVTRRKWRSQDDPHSPSTGTKGGEDTPYSLRTQQLILVITGESTNIKTLLAQLHQAKKLLHTQRLVVKPMNTNGGPIAAAGDDKNMLLLDMELTLFNLELDKPEPGKKPA